MRPGLLFADDADDVFRAIATAADLNTALGLSGPAADTADDLGLPRIWASMAHGDAYLEGVAQLVLATPLLTTAHIRHRQAALTDFRANPGAASAIYRLAADAVEAERRIWGAGMRNPELVMSRAIEVLEVFLSALTGLRRLAAEHADGFTSPAFTVFFAQLEADVDDALLATARGQLADLRQRTIHVTAALGVGNRSGRFVLHRPPEPGRRLRARVQAAALRGQTLQVLLRDQNAMNTLAEVRAQAIAPAAAALTQSAGHILAFFRRLRFEMGFYVGALNLERALADAGVAVCRPDPLATGSTGSSFRGLRDPGLALATGRAVEGSDLALGDAPLVIATGAGGGTWTLLRAVGIAQIMMQAGMSVAAEAFTADIRHGVFTHAARDEDGSLVRGRLDEELARLSAIVDAAGPDSLVLLNQSFASTNEREAAAIAHEVIGALVDGGVRVWFATNLHQYAADVSVGSPWPVLFVRPQLDAAGESTHRLVAAPPSPTGDAMDLYERAFGGAAEEPDRR